MSNGEMEAWTGRDFGPASGDGTRPCAVSSGCRSSEDCVASREYSSSVFSLKTKDDRAVRKRNRSVRCWETR